MAKLYPPSVMEADDRRNLEALEDEIFPFGQPLCPLPLERGESFLGCR